MTFNPETGELTWDGGAAQFTPQQAEVFGAIARARGRPVLREWLVEQIIGEGRHPSHLSVVVCGINARLAAAGATFKIAGGRRRGFWLSAPVEISETRTVALSAEDRRALRRLVQTHHDSTLADRVYRALGDLM